MLGGISAGRRVVGELASSLDEVGKIMRGIGIPEELRPYVQPADILPELGRLLPSAKTAVRYVDASGNAPLDVVKAHDLIDGAVRTNTLPPVSKIEDAVTGLRLLGAGPKVDLLHLAPAPTHVNVMPTPNHLSELRAQTLRHQITATRM